MSQKEDNAIAQQSSSTTTTTTTTTVDMNLSTLDKIKRFFFSKEEWEAYLLERLEEEKRKKDGKSCAVEEDSENKNVIAWIKTVFPCQDDANTFLKSQLDKLQEESRTKPKT